VVQIAGLDEKIPVVKKINDRHRHKGQD